MEFEVRDEVMVRLKEELNKFYNEQRLGSHYKEVTLTYKGQVLKVTKLSNGREVCCKHGDRECWFFKKELKLIRRKK